MFAHFRPVFVAFLNLALGIWFAELFRQGKIVYFIVFVSILSLVILLSFFHFFLKTKFFDYLWKTLCVTITALISFLIGFGMFIGLYNKISSEKRADINSSSFYSIAGELRFSPIKYEDRVTMFIDDVILTDSGEEVFNLESGMYISIKLEDLSEDSDVFTAKAGDVILLSSKVRKINVFSKDEIYTYAYKNDYRYFANSCDGRIDVIEGTQSGIDSVRQYIKDIFYKSMSDRYAGLAYALFVGDVSGIDYDMQNNFEITGIAHLLAVSGLNTALMAMVLVWIFRKIGVKPKYSVIIVALILGFYCILCDFAPSVLRASLMSVFLLFGQSVGKQTDNLTSVSLAGIILLIISPMYLFDLSFLLSFASVFGIFFLYPIFEKMFLKLKLGKFVSSNLALSLAAQVATLPLLINTFGKVSVISLLVNLIIVPFVGYVYIAMFVSLMIIMIMPFMWWLLWLCQWGLWLVDVVSTWFATWPYAMVEVQAIATLVLVVYFIALFCFSRFCIVSKRGYRISVNCSIAVVVVLLLILNYTVFPLLM